MVRKVKADKVYEKQVTVNGNEQTVSLPATTLKEALNPALSKDFLLIPGFNARCTETPDGKYIYEQHPEKRKLKLHFLTPHFEQMLLGELAPILAELRTMLESDLPMDQLTGGALPELLQSLAGNLISSIEDYPQLLSEICSKICEASITLDRRYKMEELTDQDYADMEMLSVEFFRENVPVDYMFKSIVLPQYNKLAIAEAVKLFFSKVKSTLSGGLVNLIQNQIS